LLRRFAPRNDGHCERSEAIQSNWTKPIYTDFGTISGIMKERLRIARVLKENSIAINLISQITELPIDTILKL